MSWVGQKFHSSFSITSYWKTRMNFLAKPILFQWKHSNDLKNCVHSVKLKKKKLQKIYFWNTVLFFSFIKAWKWKWKSFSCVKLFATPWTSPWNSQGQNTGVGCLSLLWGIFPTQGSNPGLLHCRWILYQLSYQGSPHQGLTQIWASNCKKIQKLEEWNISTIFLPWV